MSRKVKSFVPAWNVGPDSSGPASVDVQGRTFRIGLATRHELASRGIAKKDPATLNLLLVAERFAASRGKAMIWAEDLFRADVAVQGGVQAEKVAEASDAAVRKVTGEIARKTDADANARSARRGHAKERRVVRVTAVETAKAEKAKARKEKRDAAKAAKAE